MSSDTPEWSRTDHELPDEVEPAEGWEYAGRELLGVEAERVQEQAREISLELRRKQDPSCGVPKRGTTHQIRQLIYRLERLAAIVEELDPNIATADEAAEEIDEDVGTEDAVPPGYAAE